MEASRLKDIAEKAGVSIKTVSRVIHEPHDVKKETRVRIQKLLEEMSYSPNQSARALRLRKTNTLGFVFPQITNEFFLEVALSLERAARLRGYSVILSSTEETYESELDSLRVLVSKRVDGIVLVSVGSTGDYLNSIVERHRIPVVLIGNRVEGLKACSVLQENEKGAFLLAEHLAAHGHSRIAYITGPLDNSSAQDRFHGHKMALSNRGLFDDRLVIASDWTYSGGAKATRDLMERSTNKPTAISYANANMALGALKTFREMGVRVPQDVAITSFENISITDYVEPPLTTLNNVGVQIGETAFDLMEASICPDPDAAGAAQAVVEARLVVRESCGCRAVK